MPTTTPAARSGEVLAAHLTRNRLKRSAQREAILDAFREGRAPRLGRGPAEHRAPPPPRGRPHHDLPHAAALQGGGARERAAFGGEARFEPIWNRDHHDHFVCVSCGEILEFQSPEIERLQSEIAAGIGFRVEGHRHHVFGRCRRCASKPAAVARPR